MDYKDESKFRKDFPLITELKYRLKQSIDYTDALEEGI
jgi:hypothetical protein